MATILQLDATLASKLATIVVNAQEYAETGHGVYWEAVSALLDDATVNEWVASLGPLAPLPRGGSR